jgi:hypothetical protein
LPTKRISGVTDNGFWYELEVRRDCKFNPVTNTCHGNCNGTNEDCTLRKIKSDETLRELNVRNIIMDLEIEGLL